MILAFYAISLSRCASPALGTFPAVLRNLQGYIPTILEHATRLVDSPLRLMCELVANASSDPIVTLCSIKDIVQGVFCLMANSNL